MTLHNICQSIVHYVYSVCIIIIILHVVADLGVRGIWQTQTEALFNIRVFDTDARSYVSRSVHVQSVLELAEREKKKKYHEAAVSRHASFTPFVVSVDGVIGREASSVEKLASKWSKPYSTTLNWI